MKTKLNNISELSFEYVDENNVRHVDAYSMDENEEGTTIGYLINNEFYPATKVTLPDWVIYEIKCFTGEIEEL